MSTVEAAEATPGTASEAAAVSSAREVRIMVVLLGEVTYSSNPPGGLGERASPTTEFTQVDYRWPRSRPRATASARLVTPSLRKSVRVWLLTVLNDT